MKIEFCCKRMEEAWYEDELSHDGGRLQYWDDDLTWTAIDDTCPYCKAKIEITVKEKNGRECVLDAKR